MSINTNFHLLYSGSSGNSAYVKIGTHELLFDIGRSCRATCEALTNLGTSPKNIEAIFITHEHTDHILGALNFVKKYGTPLHMTYLSAAACNYLNPIMHDVIFNVELGEVRVSSFITSHDSRASVGYIIEGCGVRLGIATDLGILEDSIIRVMSGCDAVIIESNYDENMLKYGDYPFHLKQRISSRFGHLSNSDCANFAKILAKSGTKNIMLAHLSDKNNTPQFALDKTRSTLRENGLDASVFVASRTEVTRFFEL